MLPYEFNKFGISNLNSFDNLLTPLTLVADESNSSVKITKAGSPTTNGLKYRISEDDDWMDYTINTEILLKNKNDYVQFFNTKGNLGLSNNDYCNFVMTGLIKAYRKHPIIG